MKIIGITGFAGSGKDTLADAIRLEALRKGINKVHIYHIAGELKRRFSTATGMTLEQIEQQKRKDPLLRYLLQITGDWMYQQGDSLVVLMSTALDNLAKNNLVIIPDVRYLTESETLKLKHAYIVRVNRPGYEGVNNHATETELVQIPQDYTVWNNQTIKYLEMEAKNILTNIGL